MTVKTHPLLPDLPDGQFWRVRNKPSGLGFDYVHVDLRRRGRWCTWSIEAQHTFPDEIENSARATAVWLARKIYDRREHERMNVLGDLEGDHPSD